jgi:methylase of polypeptide subunit release factors
MSTLTKAKAPLSLSDPEGVAILRKVFADADYSDEGIRKALGVATYASVPPGEFPQLLKTLAPGTPLASLIQPFLLGLPIDASVLERAIRPLTLQRLEALGLIQLEGGNATPKVGIRPFRGGLFAADLRPKDLRQLPADFVLEENPTSEHVANITPRRRITSALDVGSGCGVLAILAAAHSDKVVATDINPRALNFTAFNAALNGVSNIECLEGSLLDPVAGRTFDLIMMNPPFVISPDSNYQFRDNGRPEDSFCRELVRAFPAHLNEGGIGVMICDWALHKGQAWAAVAAEWVSGLGCDSLLFRTTTLSPVEYAANWNRPLSAFQPEAYEAAVTRWVAHFRKLGIESIAAGRIIIRKRATPEHWVFSVDGSEKWSSNSGEHLLRILEAHDWVIRAREPEDYLGTVFRPAEDLRLEQILESHDGRMQPLHAWASLSTGFQLRARIDPIVWHLLTLSDGRRPLQETVDDLARMSNTGPDIMGPRVVSAARDLYGAGFLMRG